MVYNISECPGGAESVCSRHGQCNDGMAGSGLCTCDTGYKGHACQTCDMTSFHCHLGMTKLHNYSLLYFSQLPSIKLSVTLNYFSCTTETYL